MKKDVRTAGWAPDLCALGVPSTVECPNLIFAHGDFACHVGGSTIGALAAIASGMACEGAVFFLGEVQSATTEQDEKVWINALKPCGLRKGLRWSNLARRQRIDPQCNIRMGSGCDLVDPLSKGR